MSVLANKKTPSKNPFYRFVLEEMCGGITHRFQRKITKTLIQWIILKVII